MPDFEYGSIMLKAIGEPVRMQILDILSQGEMCACDILQNLPISQPTLSHHMKALTAAGWVNAHKKATWMYYSVNAEAVDQLHQFMINLTSRKVDGPDRAVCNCCPENTLNENDRR